MNVNGASDLARLQDLQRQGFSAREALDRAGLELTTGQVASRYEATGGNLTRIFSLERSLERNAVFAENITLTELRLDTVQQTLGRFVELADSTALPMLQANGMGDVAAMLDQADIARRDFAETIGKLNTRTAGQSLFAGTETGNPAVDASNVILADLDALAAGAATAADAITAIEDYFSSGPPAGAFHTTRYTGATDDLAPVDIGEGQRLAWSIRADADEIVGLLQAQAIAAVVAGGAFAGSAPEQTLLVGEAGRQMLAAKDALLELRGSVGISQEAVEQARASRVAEREMLEEARANLVAVDQAEAASTFQYMESQLEAIYTVTARISSLRFSNFLR